MGNRGFKKGLKKYIYENTCICPDGTYDNLITEVCPSEDHFYKQIRGVVKYASYSI